MAGNYGKGKAAMWLKAHVSHQGDACLPWPFARDSKGYGSLGHKGKRYWAHRLMCEWAHGAPPTPRHHAAHECGNGVQGCVNPKHLSWKTPLENHLDCRKTGRMARNMRGNRSILKPEQIAQILALKGKMSQIKIAKMFGISTGSVQYWQHEKARRYVEKPEPQYRIDALLAGGPLPFMDLAQKYFPDPRSWRTLRPGSHACLATLADLLNRYGFEQRDGIVYPRNAKAA